MIELAFTYIQQKFGRELDMRFTIPKMKYKGSTIQYQRIRAKKGPKISEVEMTPEEKKAMEEQAFEEEKRREAMREKEPKWKLYCILDERLNKDFASEDFVTNKIIKTAFDNECTGDDNDRWTYLQENFEMKQQFDVFEEYDGLNNVDSSGLMLVVHLPLLSRGHAIQCHFLSDEHV